MALFNRIAELEVGQPGGKGVLIRDLRFSFNIEKTSSETLNESTLSIYNLNKETRKLIEVPNNQVTLRAGYADDIGLINIFTGITRRTLTTREGSDWVTNIELDDGLLAYRDSKFSASFAADTKAINVLTFIANKFNLPVYPIPTDLTNKTYPTGFSFVGRTREAMAKVCDYIGADWSIQDQHIQIIKKGSSLKRTGLLISQDSGLIGSPSLESKTMSEKAASKKGITANSKGVIKRNKEQSDTSEVKQRLEVLGYKIKSLMQPTLQCGQVVKLKSEGVDGFFRVESFTHVGDTYGGEWVSDISLRFI